MALFGLLLEMRFDYKKDPDAGWDFVVAMVVKNLKTVKRL